MTPGLLRFFDGAAWTDRTTPAPSGDAPRDGRAAATTAPAEARPGTTTAPGAAPIWEPGEEPVLDPYADQVAPGSARYAVPAAVSPARPAIAPIGPWPVAGATTNPYAQGAAPAYAGQAPYAGAGGYAGQPAYAGAGGYAGQPAYPGAGGYAGQPAYPGGYAGPPGYPPPHREGSSPSDVLHWIVPVGRSGASIAAGYVGLISLAVWVLGPVAIGLGIWAMRKARTGGHGRGRAIFGIVTGVIASVLGVLVLVPMLTGGTSLL